MKKKIKSKFLSAMFLGLLVISGGVLFMPTLNADSQLTQQKSINIFAQNPERFLQTENLGLKAGFQYPKDNSVIDANNYAVNEGALESAIEEGNYEAYKEVLQELNGFPEKGNIIDKEDFNVLVALNRPKSEENESTE